MNAAKRAGTENEVRTEEWWHKNGEWAIDRMPLRGIRDRGDLHMKTPLIIGGQAYGVIIGCKNEKTISLATYMDELRQQKAYDLAANPGLGLAGVFGWEQIRRRGSGRATYPRDRDYIVCEQIDLLNLLRLIQAAGVAAAYTPGKV